MKNAKETAVKGRAKAQQAASPVASKTKTGKTKVDPGQRKEKEVAKIDPKGQAESKRGAAKSETALRAKGDYVRRDIGRKDRS